ncbi:hypothetical protein KSP40_PGU006008 [Platanthera guangdongensis]|uniref:Uncharacterized protein n=1 Tax=Platanthera guangdongensis TaxID=2320717 RepID=A0ABR2LNP7_9ASPA
MLRTLSHGHRLHNNIQAGSQGHLSWVPKASQLQTMARGLPETGLIAYWKLSPAVALPPRGDLSCNPSFQETENTHVLKVDSPSVDGSQASCFFNEETGDNLAANERPTCGREEVIVT